MSIVLGAAAGSGHFQVPLHSKKPEEGSIDYLFDRSDIDKADGLFSFTFYLENYIEQGLLYILGIYIYSQILKLSFDSGENPFSKWKILIYTDRYSYEKLKTIYVENNSVEKLKNLPMHEIFYVERGKLAEKEAQKYLGLLFHNPAVLFAIVTWPSQMRQKKSGKVNGYALRPFRSRAPFDFPTKVIFIRDADTLFQRSIQILENKLTDPSKRKNTYYYSFRLSGIASEDVIENSEKTVTPYFKNLIMKIGQWEKDFYTEIPTIQTFLGKPPLIVGAGTISSGEFYLKNWHANELLGKKAPFGIFAGFVNVVPGNPLFQTVDAWDEFLDYQTARSYPIQKASQFQLTYSVFTPEEEEKKTKNLLENWEETSKLFGFKGNQLEQNVKQKREEYNVMKKNILENIYSNNLRRERIGRDEQLYLFIFLPKILDSLYFYKIHLSDSPDEDHKANYNFHERRKSMYSESLEKGFQKAKGGKRKKRTLRLKIEKRKTRRLR
jgi:hypothetical protein